MQGPERYDPWAGAFGTALGVRAGDFVFTTALAGVTSMEGGVPQLADTFEEQLARQCRKRVRVPIGGVGGWYSEVLWPSGRVEVEAVLVGLAVVVVVQAAWQYSLMSPLQLECRRIGRPGRYATTSRVLGARCPSERCGRWRL